MPGGTVVTENLDEGKSNLNNDETHINRGVELLLRNRRAKPEPPKTFKDLANYLGFKDRANF